MTTRANNKDRLDIGEAYRKAVQLNGYDTALLTRIHRQPVDTIYRYTDDQGSDAGFQQLWELLQFILITNGILPREMRGVMDRLKKRVAYIAKDSGLYTGYTKDVKVVGSPTRPGRYHYTLNGRRVNRKDLIEMTGFTASWISKRLKNAGIKEGDDISHLDFSRKKGKSDAEKT